MKRVSKCLVVIALLALISVAVPVLASEATLGQNATVCFNVTDPMSLLWTVGTSHEAVEDYTSGRRQIQCVQNSPVHLWFESTSSQDLTGLYLSFEIPRGLVDITLVDFPDGTTIDYSSVSGAYLAGPVSVTANSTLEVCFKVIPLQRGYYTLDVQWVKE